MMRPTSRRVALKGLMGASALAGSLRSRLTFAQDTTPTPDPADANIKPATVSGPQTLVVGGLDTRKEGEPENSDVLMLVRIDLDAKTLRVISISRDLYLEIPGFGADKITRANDFGSKAQNGKFKAGAELMKATIEHNFAIEVDYVCLTTFTGFQQIVDAMGGVEVDNPYEVSDAEYPTIDYGYTSVDFPAGPQTLTGEQALQFCRTRHQDGDPGRVMRQQIVLRALLDDAANPDNADTLWNIVRANKKAVRTDLGPSKQLTYTLAVPGFSNDNVQFATLIDYMYADTAPDGSWIYSGVWDQIPNFVAGFLDGSINVDQTITSG
jgi:LCP family protein required for cell wall assembly